MEVGITLGLFTAFVSKFGVFQHISYIFSCCRLGGGECNLGGEEDGEDQKADTGNWRHSQVVSYLEIQRVTLNWFTCRPGRGF